MTLIRGIFALTWSDETYSLMVNDSKRELSDYEAIKPPNEVELDEDSIDGVLIFGSPNPLHIRVIAMIETAA